MGHGNGEPDNTFANDFFNKRNLPVEGLYKNRAARVSPLGEFGNADRKWRNQFLKDQVLSEADTARHPSHVRNHHPPTPNLFF